MDLSDWRQDYQKGGLRRADLPAEPETQFRRWLDEAVAAGLAEPNAMALATVSPDGQPSVRTVLLKAFDAQGFVFFTNYQSPKALDLAGNPRAALLFAWLPLERQVRITGSASRIGVAESLRYFVSRPLGSRLGAWVSAQSRVISSRQVLEMKWDEMKRRFADGQVPLPSFWGGFRVRAETFEFWQGRSDRLHDRFRYSREDEGAWRIERLAP